MQIGISIVYSDIFSDPPPALSQVLEAIPSELSITILAMINAEIYMDHSEEKQSKILWRLLARQPLAVRESVSNEIAKIKSQDGPRSINIFATTVSLEFLHYELVHFRCSDITDLTIQDELNFFKAYLIFADQLNSSRTYAIPKGLDGYDPFQSKLWPVLMDQVQVDHPILPIYEVPKSLSLLNYFEFVSPYNKYVDSFLSANSKATSWNYVLDIIALFPKSIKSSSADADEIYPFVINPTDDFTVGEFHIRHFRVSHQIL